MMTFAFDNMKVVEIPLDKLTADPDQPRKHFTDESIEELAASMRQHGQIYPMFIIPFNDHFQIVDGERRWRALGKAGIEHARVIVLSDKPEPADIQLLQLVSNCHRSDLTPLELSDAYANLMETGGFNVTQLAQSLSRSKGHVSSILGLRKLVPDVRELVASGKIAGTAATQIARLPEAEQMAMADDLAHGRIERSQLERRVSRKKNPTDTQGKRIGLELVNMTFFVVSSQAVKPEQLVVGLEQLTKECKRGFSQGFDVSTMARVLRDRAKAQAAGGVAC